MIIEIMYPHYLFSGLEFVLANKYGIFIICQLVAWLKNLGLGHHRGDHRLTPLKLDIKKQLSKVNVRLFVTLILCR